jgi:hypothetical protein
VKFGASRDNKYDAFTGRSNDSGKALSRTTSSYVELSPEEVAALKAAKKEAEAGKKKEEVKENKALYNRYGLYTPIHSRQRDSSQ